MIMAFPRVAITPLTDKDPIKYGVFVGLISNSSSCDRCDSDIPSAAVLLDGEGLFVKAIHLSRVTLIHDRNSA